ncbi:DUF6314 family protein [Yoonia sp.]|uniref:DUF6314 family protein n=1 Tax=Yoonia sp. TaxID=2212373 RepID=UPI0025D8871B|nr:DUF6314 family protein [Yoonia sp.]
MKITVPHRTSGDFAGGWQLRRMIADRLTGQDGQLTGTAHFADAGQGRLKYTETGQLRLGHGPVLAATRSYFWQFADDRVAVTFADGAAFHSFAPAGHAAGTDHPCGADFYTVRYDFTRWPEWQATWVVTGPRKDYSSVSVYAP